MLRGLGSLAAVSLLGIAIGAAAAPGFRGPAPFSSMDLDQDGVITSGEFEQHRSARQAARAGQGRPMRNAANAPRFEDWDLDSDGRLTPAELTSGQQARFASRRPFGRPCRRAW